MKGGEKNARGFIAGNGKEFRINAAKGWKEQE